MTGPVPHDTRRRTAGRAGSVAAAVLCLLAGWAAPAEAHAGGLVATDARSLVVAVTPAVAGLEVATIEGGARLRLRNRTPGPITVPSTSGATTEVPPSGELIWADTRTTPAGRDVAAGARTGWSFTLDAAGTPVTVTGELIGEPRPSPVPWWAAAALLTIAVPLSARRLRRPDLALAALGMVAAAASIAHVAGSTLAVESAPPLGTFLDASGVNLLAWPLVLGGAVAITRGRPAGILAVCAGAALTAVVILPDVTGFHRAVLPFAGPATVERLLVLLALSTGAGTAIAGARVLRRLAASTTSPAATPG